jgi:hypothetical protein
MAAIKPGETLRLSKWDRWTIRFCLPLTNGLAIGKGISGFRQRGVTAMKTTFFSEFIRTAKEAPRLHFLALVGVVMAIKAEFLQVKEAEGNTPPHRRAHEGSFRYSD